MLSYAGVSLPVLTQEAYTTIESRISLKDLYAWDIVPSDVGRAGFGLAAKKWQDRTPRLGRLSWPTGASRWATGFFLATDVQLAAIREVVYADDSYAPADLVIGDGTNSITASMYMLPARPLFTGAEGQELWLLVLVDRRYFWWQDRTGILSIAADTSWASFYSTLSGHLPIGSLVADTVATAYLTVPVTLSAVEESLPPYLDYVARSVGQRIVVPLTGTEAQALSYDSSYTTQQANLELAKNRLAGGELKLISSGGDTPGFYPQAVEVNFQQSDSYGQQLDLLSSLSVSNPSGNPSNSFTITIDHPFLAVVSDGTWTNETDCSSLAQQYVEDYYDYLSSSLDIVYAGIVQWEPEGLEDWVEWTYTRDMVSTRVQRAPRVIGEPKLNATAGTIYGYAESEVASVGPGDEFSSDVFTWPDGCGYPTLANGNALLEVTPGSGNSFLEIVEPGFYLIGASVVWNQPNVSSPVAEGYAYITLPVTNTAASGTPPFQQYAYEYLFVTPGGDFYENIPATLYYCQGNSQVRIEFFQATPQTLNAIGSIWALRIQPASGTTNISGGGGGGGGGEPIISTSLLYGANGVVIENSTPALGATTIGLGVIDCGTWV